MTRPTPTTLDNLPPDEFAARVAKLHPEFAATYYALSAAGACDGWGGMESRRVYREWVEAGRPLGVGGFIVDRANTGPIR